MFKKKLAIAAVTALAAAALIAAPAAATADIKTGNADTECRAIGYDTGVKLDTGTPGDYVYPDTGPWEPDGKSIALTATIHTDHTFEWTSAPAIGAVLVKAGLIYTIFPGGTSGSGDLEAEGVKFGISHITFCWDDDVTHEDPDESITVTKTIDTSYQRQHHWTLDKSVTPGDIKLYAPGAAGPHTGSADWTIDVGYDGYTDSGHKVTGVVTVTNTGDGAVAVSELVDTLTVNDVPGVIELDCGDQIDLDVGTVVLQPLDFFSCTYDVAVPEDSVVSNSATAETLSGLSATGTATAVWGDPTVELDRMVTLSDVGDLPTPADVPFTAPNGGQVTYSHDFAWADYGADDCGTHTYDNTATLSSSQVGLAAVSGPLPLTDSASLNVHVQCYVFQGETAWAANTTAGTLPYNTKKGGNWATYVKYPQDDNVYNLYAGQTMLAGTATITPAGAGLVQVTVDLTGPWDYAEGGTNLHVQGYDKAPSGNPSPGLFASHTTCTGDPCTTAPIPLKAFYGIHLDVGKWVPDPSF